MNSEVTGKVVSDTPGSHLTFAEEVLDPPFAQKPGFFEKPGFFAGENSFAGA